MVNGNGVPEEIDKYAKAHADEMVALFIKKYGETNIDKLDYISLCLSGFYIQGYLKGKGR